MYCQLDTAFASLQPVQLTDDARQPPSEQGAMAVGDTCLAAPAAQPRTASQAHRRASSSSAWGDVSDRQLLLLFGSLVLLLLLVLVVVLVQLSHSQTALLRALAWRR